MPKLISKHWLHAFLYISLPAHDGSGKSVEANNTLQWAVHFYCTSRINNLLYCTAITFFNFLIADNTYSVKSLFVGSFGFSSCISHQPNAQQPLLSRPDNYIWPTALPWPAHQTIISVLPPSIVWKTACRWQCQRRMRHRTVELCSDRVSRKRSAIDPVSPSILLSLGPTGLWS